MKPWFAHYDANVSTTLDYPHTPLWTLLERAAERFPQRVALKFMGLNLSYEELWTAAQRFAQALQSLGVTKGERVALMLPNCPQYMIAFYGALLAGAVVVNMSPLNTPRELEMQLLDSGSQTLVTLSMFYPRYREIAERVPLDRVIVTGVEDYLPFPKNVLFPLKARKEGVWVKVKPAPGVFLLKQLLASASPTSEPRRFASASFERVSFSPEDPAVLQYTGGTTGTPKAVVLSHDNLMANAAQISAWMPDAKEGAETLLAAIPFFHIYGVSVALNVAVKLAATLILLPRFNVSDVLKAIQQHRPTYFPGVPTMYVALNNHPGIERYKLSSIQTCVSGAAPLPIEVARAFERLAGANLVEGYGLTEAGPVTHVNPLLGERRAGSIGVPLPGIDARIVDAEGNTLPCGEIGELAVSGPNVMQGYWQRPEETKKCIRDGLDGGRTPGRWLLTGDMARMGADGYFEIVDRKKDMINAAGLNVYPREVEEVLYTHEAVKEVVVVGVPDAYRGETVKAYVVLKTGMTLTEAELVAFARTQLAAYKVPRIIEFRAELPKTLIGKILRRVLLEEERLQANDPSVLAAFEHNVNAHEPHDRAQPAEESVQTRELM